MIEKELARRLDAVPDPVFTPAETPPVDDLPSSYALLSHPSAPSAAIERALKREQERAASRERAETGLRLRGAREKAGLTQVELAGLAGTKTATVGKLERGEEMQDRAEKLESLAGALGKDVEALTRRFRGGAQEAASGR